MLFLAKKVLSDDFLNTVQDELLLNELLDGIDVKIISEMSLLEQNRYEFVHKTFHSYLMQYLGGKQEMTFGISGRLPFLDLYLIRYILKVSPEILLYKNTEKYLLRELYKDKLPSKIINRKKHGFSSSALSPFLKYKPDYFVEALSIRNMKNMGIFCPYKTSKFLEETERLPIRCEERNLSERIIVFIISLYLLNNTLIKS